MKISRKINVLLTYVACLVLAFAVPMSVYAEEPVQTDSVVSESTEPQPPAVTDPIPPAPLAPEAPAPAEPIPPTPPEQPPQTYVYDADTQKWNSNDWRWDSTQNKYVPVEKQPVNEKPEEVTAESTTNTSTNASITNALESIAESGDAGVLGNTKAGSATTGDASVAANIINNVNSTMTNANNQQAATFVMDIMGDVNGDIMLEPMLLKAMLEAEISGSNTANFSNTATIGNDVNLNATSGDALVSRNTTAGDATSGSANAMANVMNMVNSMIAANQSFEGTINIYGNLNGDILIAPDFIAQMLANNGIDADASKATVVNARDTQEIVNNVSLAAHSGAALVAGNTSAGNATSGDAETNLVIFNMTGHEIVAANSLLVFINVLGKWVGVIVDAPTGATAAAIGSGVTKNDINPSMVIDASNHSAITNNLTLTARSGDAAVTNNTTAGNARTGNATASANIANISNSQLGLTGWFGRLFINVFGTWCGSFGINTTNCDSVPDASSPVNMHTDAPQVIRFIPHSEQESRSAVQRLRIVTPTQAAEHSRVQQASESNAKSVLAATDTRSDIPSQQSYIDARKELNVPLVVVSLTLILVSGFALRRFLF